jgi:hypothetical protein
MHDKSGMRKQSHKETFRYPQLGNDKRKKRSQGRKEKQKGISETIINVIQESRQMEQTTGNWESWQQEIDNERDWLEEDKGKEHFYIRNCRK